MAIAGFGGGLTVGVSIAAVVTAHTRRKANTMNENDYRDVYVVIKKNGDGPEDWMGGIKAGPNVLAQMAFGHFTDADKFRIHIATRDGISPDDLDVVAFRRIKDE